MADEETWIDVAPDTIKAAMEAGRISLGAVVDDWRTVGALDDPSAFETEDAEDRSKLVRFSDVVEELHAMRDQILNQELPPVMEGLWRSIEQWWGNLVDSFAGWVDLLGKGQLAGLYVHYRRVASLSSPRSFVGRVNAARREAEQRLRRKALFAKGEKRYVRKIAHRL